MKKLLFLFNIMVLSTQFQILCMDVENPKITLNFPYIEGPFGENEEDPRTLESFEDILNDPKNEDKELILVDVVTEVAGKEYHTNFVYKSLYDYFITLRKAINPVDQQPIIRISMYNYDPEKNVFISNNYAIEAPFSLEEDEISGRWVSNTDLVKRLVKELNPHQSLEQMRRMINPEDIIDKYTLEHDQALGLRDLSLEEIPEEFFVRLARLYPHLKALNLSSNKLQKLEGLRHLTNLKDLFLDENELTEIPELNDNIEHLSLRGNKLQDKVIKNLPHLNSLVLDRNNFFELTIRDLPELDFIGLNGNTALETLTILNLPKLRTLFLRSEPNLESLILINLPNLARLKISGCPRLRNFSIEDVNPQVDIEIKEHLENIA